MATLSYAILLVLAMIAFVNLRQGTLGAWLKAKVFNAGDPNREHKREGVQPPGGLPDWVPGVGAGPAGAAGLINPLPGGRVSAQGHFGDCRDGCSRRHQGIDLFLPAGTPIKAAGGGRVTFAGHASGYGLRVDIDHGNGWLTRYAHNTTNGVRVGDVVAAGQVIATVGATGNADGPHLHFETHNNGTPVDPAGVIPGIGGG